MMISPPASSPAPTVANFYYINSSNSVNGSNLTFVSASSGPITAYYWDFGDGSPIAYGKIVTHTYVAEGTYTVTLTVTDAHGLTTSTQETVDVSQTTTPAPQQTTTINFTISPNPSMINWGWENAGIVNKTLTFNAVASNFPSGFKVNYSWSFGDGATGVGAVVSHAYQQEGNYSVTLTALDADGNVQSTTQQVQILPMPAATIYVGSLPITVSQSEIGQTITLNIMISNVTDLFIWQAGMTFNPSVLQCIPASNPSNVAPNVTTTNTIFTEGDFLKKGGTTLWIPGWVTNGTIAAHMCSLLNSTTNPATPQSGSGILATVTFKVIGSGDLDIHLTNVLLLNIEDSEIPVYVAT